MIDLIRRRKLAISLAAATAAVAVVAYDARAKLTQTRVEFFETDELSFSLTDQLIIIWRAASAVAEARSHLPTLNRPLLIRVQSARVNEVRDGGDDAFSAPPDTVVWSVDVGRQGGATSIASKQLRATLLHELNHLARSLVIQSDSVLERVVSEGLAITFERDYGQISKPWSWYTDDAMAWADEVLALPSTEAMNAWMATSPDGRAWVVFKAGTFLVDQAATAAHKTTIELLSMPAEEILALARSQHARTTPRAASVCDD